MSTFYQTLSMHSLKRLFLNLSPSLNSRIDIKIIQRLPLSTKSHSNSSSSSRITTGDDEWNDAWESAWLPDDLSTSSSSSTATSPWEADITLPSADMSPSPEIDADTKAFVAEMDERWNERRASKKASASPSVQRSEKKKDVDEYRARKQRIHARLWMKQIEKMEEAKLGNSTTAGDDIDRLLDSCSERVLAVRVLDSGFLIWVANFASKELFW